MAEPRAAVRRYLEEFEAEDVYRHWPGKTVTEADNHLFCELTMAVSPIHTDHHFAEREMDGGRNLVVGTYVYALLLGMSVPDTSGRALAALGTARLRHIRPVHPRRHAVRGDARGQRAAVTVAAAGGCGRRRDAGDEPERRAGVRVRTRIPRAEAPVIESILGPDEFRDRVCIVTGAARGIGAAIAECLARHGGTVVVADIDLDGAVERAGLLAERGHRAVPCRVDVSSGADVERMMQDVCEREGPPSVLINNAGIVTVAPSDQLPGRDRWRRQIDVMLTGTFLMTQAAAQSMLAAGGGAIVNLSSIGGFGGHPGRSAYNAAKAGISCLTQVLGVEWAAPRDSRERGGAGGDADGDAEARAADVGGRHQAGGIRGPNPDGADCRARGDRRMRRVPGVEQGELHHRQHALDRRRLDGQLRDPRAGGVDPRWPRVFGSAGRSSSTPSRGTFERRFSDACAIPLQGDAMSLNSITPGTAADETAALLAAAAHCARDNISPVASPASFIGVVPVWGVLAHPMDVQAELAAAAAHALAQVRIEEWSRRGRRFNVVGYGALGTTALPGLRPRRCSSTARPCTGSARSASSPMPSTFSRRRPPRT